MQVKPPMLVGESNPYGTDPKWALYPYPERSAGYRLCGEILGLRRAEYLRRFERVNLLTGSKWSVPKAREVAARLLLETETDRVYVLFGRRVAAAFEFDCPPFLRVDRAGSNSVGNDIVHRFVLLPHPSGRCRIWNERGAIDEARRLLREAGAL